MSNSRDQSELPVDSVEYRLGRLMDEFVERFRRGERPGLTEYVSRCPDLEVQIRELLPTLVAMEQAGPPLDAETLVGRETPAPKSLGDFRIVREIGRGGMGLVYEAVQESLGRTVALKVLHASAALDERQQFRFRREARTAAQLHHSNIVPVFGVGQHESILYYAMQYIAGRPLDEVLIELQRLAPDGEGHAFGVRVQDPLSASVAQALRTGSLPVALGVPNEQAADSTLPDRAEFQRQAEDNSIVCDGDAKSAEVAPGAATASHLPSATVAPGTASDKSSYLDNDARIGNGNDSATLGLTGNLSDSLTGRNHFLRSVSNLGVQAAEALEYAHSRGVLHRDIKPSNLLLDLHGTIWVADFGLARTMNDNITQPGDLVGTLRYMAPERFRGECDHRSDIYSLGLTLYELLVLRPAFDESDKQRLIRQITHSVPALPRSIDSDIPRDLETIVLKAIAKEPRSRYQTAAQLADDLRRFLSERPIAARRTSPRERAWLWCRRNPLVATLSGLLAVLLVTVAAGSSIAVIELNRRHVNALQLLGRARNAEQSEREARVATDQQRQQAVNARREADNRLFQSLLLEVRAVRNSDRPGRRWDGLATIGRAVGVLDRLKLSDDLRGQLRDEAVACLALADFRLDQSWSSKRQSQVAVHAKWAFDRNVERYARALPEGDISIRSISTDNELVRLTGVSPFSEDSIPRLLFGPDDRFLAARFPGNELNFLLRLWDLTLRKEILNVSVSTIELSRNFDVGTNPDRLIYHGSDDYIHVVELPTGVERSRFYLPNVQDVRFDSATDRFVVGQPDGSVSIRQLTDGTEIVNITCASSCSTFALSHDGRSLAFGSIDGSISVFDLRTPQTPIALLRGHSAQIVDLEFSADDAMLCSSAYDADTRVWDPINGDLVARFERHNGSRFSADGRWLGLEARTRSEISYRIGIDADFGFRGLYPDAGCSNREWNTQ